MSTNSASPNQETLDQKFPKNSPNKRLKTQNSPSYKGKLKVEDEWSCGICLYEEGKAIRGYIDSCDHYFCFVCIMEWAKVESRCPMCKRRFSSIRRPPKDGVFSVERVVNVPVRDQAYHYFGNTTVGPHDPYSEVVCTVCQNTSNESLLLLCDLCDSASHTYCVGLGGTVPEGDWYCHDCTLLRDEHSKDDMDPDYGIQTGSKTNDGCQTQREKFAQIPSAETLVSILDIVREPISNEVHESSASRSRLLSTVVAEGEASVGTTIDTSGRQPSDGHRASQLGARTLRRCRNVHSRIRALRENWNAFRQGSLSFSANCDEKRGIGPAPHARSGQANSSSCSNQQSTSQKASSCSLLPDSGTGDIDKAWKMMDVAKSIEKGRRRTGVGHQASTGSKHPLRKVNTPKQADRGSSTKVLTSNSIENKYSDGLKLEKHHLGAAISRTNERNKDYMSEGIKLSGGPKRLEGYSATRPISYPEVSTSAKVKNLVQVSIFNGNSGNLLQNRFHGGLSNVVNGIDGRQISAPVAENDSLVKQVLCASSSSDLDVKDKMENKCVDYESKKDDDAKCEIQSLVKLNLKLLSRDKKIEAVAFKEVARLATHSILATCGIGRPKHGIRSFPSSICNHINEDKKVRRSTLMPTSCRECFFVFVKDVVNTIMLEKMGN